MKTLHLVIKSPAGIEGTVQVVGVFDTVLAADAACHGAGDFLIYQIDANRAYQAGQLLDVRMMRVLEHRQLK